MTQLEVSQLLEDHLRVINEIKEQLPARITECSAMLVKVLTSGGKLLVMGNGGSAGDAQHLAAEFVGRFLMERRALPAIALTTDTSILTAIGNDYGFDDVFKRQVEALANPGDVLIGISTSGNSPNVRRALEAGKKIGATTIGLLGRTGGEIGAIVDVGLVVPSFDTPRIQEAHLLIIHILCELVEKGLFGRQCESPV